METYHSETGKLQAIIDSSVNLEEHGEDYGAVLDFVGDASVVLLGESTRGSQEFYRARADITKMLIQKKGFKAVAATTDCNIGVRLNRFVNRGTMRDSTFSENESYAEAMSHGGAIFPKWVWENQQMENFFLWLRMHNETMRTPAQRIGFHGLDLFNFYDSASFIIRNLERTIPTAAASARYFFSGFESIGRATRLTKAAAQLNLSDSLEQENVTALTERLKNSHHDADTDRHKELDDTTIGDFSTAAQKSRTIAGAEQFYRNMLRDTVSLWQLRDVHMAEALQKLRQDLERAGEAPRVVVWAHSLDSGDAQATEMSRLRKVNFGQMVKQAYGHDTVSIGLTTYLGTVTVSSSWNGVAEVKAIPQGRSTSYEHLFHKTGIPRFFLEMKHDSEVGHALRDPQTELAMGAIVEQNSKRSNHFYRASLPFQFDAIIHLDRTSAFPKTESETPELARQKNNVQNSEMF